MSKEKTPGLTNQYWSPTWLLTAKSDGTTQRLTSNFMHCIIYFQDKTECL